MAKALKAKRSRVIDVKVRDVFGVYAHRIVVAIDGEKARVLNSETGRLSLVRVNRLQAEYSRPSQKDGDAVIREVVRKMPKLATMWGLVAT